MSIIIKPLETEEEARGQAYVHYHAWQETYAGLVDPTYLCAMSLEMSERYALRALENGFYSTLIARDGERVIGFASYGPYRGDDLEGAGEVFAIYTLKEYYDCGIGRAMMETALSKLTGYSRVCVWVLWGNERAIRFYSRCGFSPDGAQKTLKLGTEVTEIRMLREM